MVHRGAVPDLPVKVVPVSSRHGGPFFRLELIMALPLMVLLPVKAVRGKAVEDVRHYRISVDVRNTWMLYLR
jgi:hypothetical protein